MAGEHDPWAAHRRRAEVLRERYGFASQMLTLYIALTEAWSGSTPDDVVERVVKATIATGPPLLADEVRGLDADVVMAAWLDGGDLSPVEQYLARACLVPQHKHAVTPLGERLCPHCGGLPQLSFRQISEPLVSEPRLLLCSRCAEVWSLSRSACAFCGETESAQRPLYAEEDGKLPPHLGIDACLSCRHYLIDVDVGRDREAVPEVDELAALPLDLYAADQGLTKITPNIMGF
jgi:FdhE protein